MPELNFNRETGTLIGVGRTANGLFDEVSLHNLARSERAYVVHSGTKTLGLEAPDSFEAWLSSDETREETRIENGSHARRPFKDEYAHMAEAHNVDPELNEPGHYGRYKPYAGLVDQDPTPDVGGGYYNESDYDPDYIGGYDPDRESFEVDPTWELDTDTDPDTDTDSSGIIDKPTPQ